jgi:hypothetical protein
MYYLGDWRSDSSKHTPTSTTKNLCGHPLCFACMYTCFTHKVYFVTTYRPSDEDLWPTINFCRQMNYDYLPIRMTDDSSPLALMQDRITPYGTYDFI